MGHPNIKFTTNTKFTMELEENREVPFLDVCIKRNHNTFSTTIHHKKTFNGLHTKLDSFILLGSIRSISSEHLPTVAYSSVQNPLYCTLSYLKNSLPQNGYPRGVIDYND